MRFGKRLAEVTQNGRDTQPYISYKDLKKSVGEISRLAGKENDDDGDNSSGEEDSSVPVATNFGGSSSSSAARMIKDRGPGTSKLEAKQTEFFSRIDRDLERASAHVRTIIASLEAAVGEWQSAAIVAGLLYTDVQLDEVSARLPFQMSDRQMLVKWLMDFQPAARQKAARQGLVGRYTAIANTMNSLLQYVEVNLTAVRKILKKFEKKVPSEVRMQHARDYKAHHDLFMPSMQHLLVTVAHMQRLIVGTGAENGAPSAAAVVAPISQIGPESLAVLTFLRGSASGPLALDDVLGGLPPARIDVYAKPGADVDNGASGLGAGIQRASPDLGKASQTAITTPPVAPALPTNTIQKGPMPGSASAHAGSSGSAPAAASEAGYPMALANFSAHSSGAVSSQSHQEQGTGPSAPSSGSQQDFNSRNNRRRGGRGGGGKGSKGQKGSGGQSLQANSTGGGRPAPSSAQSTQQEQQSHPGSASGQGQVLGGLVQSQAGGSSLANVNGMPYFFTQVPVFMGQQQQQGGFKAGTQVSQSSAASVGFDASVINNASNFGAVQPGMIQALDPNQWLAMQMRMMPQWPPQAMGMAPVDAGYPMGPQRI